MEVKELLGHRHVTTTQLYDKRRRAAREGASGCPHEPSRYLSITHCTRTGGVTPPQTEDRRRGAQERCPSLANTLHVRQRIEGVSFAIENTLAFKNVQRTFRKTVAPKFQVEHVAI
jgi:hypothetical protein